MKYRERRALRRDIEGLDRSDSRRLIADLETAAEALNINGSGYLWDFQGRVSRLSLSPLASTIINAVIVRADKKASPRDMRFRDIRSVLLHVAHQVSQGRIDIKAI